jgi:hypothetical protein
MNQEVEQESKHEEEVVVVVVVNVLKLIQNSTDKIPLNMCHFILINSLRGVYHQELK